MHVIANRLLPQVHRIGLILQYLQRAKHSVSFLLTQLIRSVFNFTKYTWLFYIYLDQFMIGLCLLSEAFLDLSFVYQHSLQQTPSPLLPFSSYSSFWVQNTSITLKYFFYLKWNQPDLTTERRTSKDWFLCHHSNLS